MGKWTDRVLGGGLSGTKRIWIVMMPYQGAKFVGKSATSSTAGSYVCRKSSLHSRERTMACSQIHCRGICIPDCIRTTATVCIHWHLGALERRRRVPRASPALELPNIAWLVETAGLTYSGTERVRCTSTTPTWMRRTRGKFGLGRECAVKCLFQQFSSFLVMNDVRPEQRGHRMNGCSRTNGIVVHERREEQSYFSRLAQFLRRSAATSCDAAEFCLPVHGRLWADAAIVAAGTRTRAGRW